MTLLEQRVVPSDFSVTLTQGPCELSPTRRALRQWLLALGVDEDWIDDVLVAAGEACNNALEHAYAGSLGTVELQAVIIAGNLNLVIRDSGVWKEPLDRGNRGRGRKLMEKLMDRAVIDSGPGGTVVRMQKALRSASPPDIF